MKEFTLTDRLIFDLRQMTIDKATNMSKVVVAKFTTTRWICANQLHKHNMIELQRMKLIQEEYEARQKTVGGQVGNSNAVKNDLEDFSNSFSKNSARMTTRPMLAKEHNISEGAVKTAVEVGRGIDKAAEVDPDFKNDVLSGNVKAKKSHR